MGFFEGVFNEPSILRIKVDNVRHLMWSFVSLGGGWPILPTSQRWGLQLREVEHLPRGGAGLRLECVLTLKPLTFLCSMWADSI